MESPREGAIINDMQARTARNTAKKTARRIVRHANTAKTREQKTEIHTRGVGKRRRGIVAVLGQALAGWNRLCMCARVEKEGGNLGCHFWLQPRQWLPEPIHSRAGSYSNGAEEHTTWHPLQACLCHHQEPVSTYSHPTTAAAIRPKHHTANLRIGGVVEARRELCRLHMDPSGNRLCVRIRGKSGSTERNKAKTGTRLPPTPPGKSTAVRLAVAKQQQGRKLPEDVGKFSKAMDAALPGKHTRGLYDKLNRREASVLARLRTGMTRLNGFLSRIGAAESDQCACGHAKETGEHFLLRCVRWTALREDMLQCTTTRRGSLSIYLGGKAPSDPKQWSPDMKAVRAAIKYAMATGRLEPDDNEQGLKEPN